MGFPTVIIHEIHFQSTGWTAVTVEDLLAGCCVVGLNQKPSGCKANVLTVMPAPWIQKNHILQSKKNEKKTIKTYP